MSKLAPMASPSIVSTHPVPAATTPPPQHLFGHPSLRPRVTRISELLANHSEHGQSFVRQESKVCLQLILAAIEKGVVTDTRPATT